MQKQRRGLGMLEDRAPRDDAELDLPSGPGVALQRLHRQFCKPETWRWAN